MERLEVHIPFFTWFPTFSSKQGLQEVFSQPSLNVQTSVLKTLHFTNGDSISSIHPPDTYPIKLILWGELIIASPYRKGRQGNDTARLDDLKRFHQQANYTNTILNTIAQQFNHTSLRIEWMNTLTKIPKQLSSYADNISQPFFKMGSIPKEMKSLSSKPLQMPIVSSLKSFLNKLENLTLPWKVKT